MPAEQLAHTHPEIVLDLRLDRSLAPYLDADRVREQVGQDLVELLEILGVPGLPRVQLRTHQQDEGGPAQVLSLSVGGQSAPFAWGLLDRVFHYVTGEIPQDAGASTSMLAALGELPAEQLSAFVRLASVEIVKKWPGRLFTPDAAAEYRSALGDIWDDSPLPDARWLRNVLSRVLELRVSIADRAKVAEVLQSATTESPSPAATAEALIAALRPQLIEIQLPYDCLQQLTLTIPESERGNFGMVRDGLFYELGVQFPAFAFVPVHDLRPDSFRFKVNDLTTIPVRGLRADECLVNDTADRLELLCIDGRAAINPANLSLCAIMPVKDVDLAERAGLTTWSQLGYLILALSAELRACAPCFLDHTEVEAQLEKLGFAFPELEEASRENISIEVLTVTLRQLLAEEVSIRNLRRILQTMIDRDHEGCPYTVYDFQEQVYRRPEAEWFEDPVNLATLIRIRMGRYLCNKYKQGDNTLVVHLLERDIESLLTNQKNLPAHQFMEQIGPLDKHRIMTAVRAELGQSPATAKAPVVLTTTPVRPVFRELIAPEYPKAAVLSYHELSPDLNIQPLARIGWSW